jgi:DNA-binding transcriptional ArsR family regulator
METRQAELFKILGVDSRIKIIELLKQRGPLGVNEMSKSLGITPSAVSQHLKILKHAGMVRNERKGYWIPYQIDPVALEKCGEFLAKICTCGCKGTGGLSEAELNEAKDKVDLLRKYKEELEAELQRVQNRIEEIGKK